MFRFLFKLILLLAAAAIIYGLWSLRRRKRRSGKVWPGP